MKRSNHSSLGRLAILLTAVMLFGTTSHALAFNGPGHMLIADIAFAQIIAAAGASLAARKTLDAIRGIMNNAKSGFEPAGKSEKQLRDAFTFAATFPDVIKSSNGTDYEEIVLDMNPILWKNGQPQKGAGKEGQRCRSWHFFDTPLNLPAGVKPKEWESNLKIAWLTATNSLADLHRGTGTGNPTNSQFQENDLKFWWLAWILHMGGDAHQPLHCAENYAFSVKGDAGGNGFKLDRQRSLHSLWDGILVTAASEDNLPISGVEQSNRSFTDVLGPVTSAWSVQQKPKSSMVANLVMERWIATGAENAEKFVYQGVIQGQKPSTTYMTRATAFARKSATLGGFRLAAILQSILS